MKSKNFSDVYYQPGENPVFCFRSGLAVYEEGLMNGALVGLGYNSAGYPLNVLTNCPSRIDYRRFGEPYAFNLTVNGCCLDFCQKLVGFDEIKEEDGLHTVLTLDSEIMPVRIRVHTLLDGTQMFTRWLEIENLSDLPANISRLCPFAGGIESMDLRRMMHNGEDISDFYSTGYVDDDEWGFEGMLSWHKLMPDTTSVDIRYNRDRHRHPVFFIRNNVTGDVWFSQIGWSGGCRFTVDYNAQQGRNNTYLAFKAEITGIAPLIILGAGESYTTPEVHIGLVHGGVDDAVNEMHAHIRKSVLNMPEADPSALLVGCGMGAEHDMSVETSKAFIDQFAEMGGEVFIIDAGWQNPPHKEMMWGEYNGFNAPDAERYPNGLKELSDYCHEKGMKFALWVEIERLGKFCPMFSEKPEWRLNNAFGEQSGNLLDMTNPEAAKWAEDELARIIAEYKLDLLRIDFNVNFREHFAMKDTPYGIKECVSLRHYEAVYAMYRRLKKRFPSVIFENCAGGGARTDLGMMKAFNHTWVSDCQRYPRSVFITNGMTMALPPERVDRLFAGMGCHEDGALDAHIRNTMLGHMSLNVVAPAAAFANPKQMEFIKHSVNLYKDFIRPFLPESRIYHHTPDTPKARENGNVIVEVASNNSAKGAVGVFNVSFSGERLVNFTPKGIDISKNYRVCFDNVRKNVELSGASIMQNGISIKLGASLASELVLYEAIP
ncbi:MAG: alpha-galactosidase [Clostridia bacterium]|nr:alpha-galactosidase [Clostridia bacterium]